MTLSVGVVSTIFAALLAINCDGKSIWSSSFKIRASVICRNLFIIVVICYTCRNELYSNLQQKKPEKL